MRRLLALSATLSCIVLAGCGESSDGNNKTSANGQTQSNTTTTSSSTASSMSATATSSSTATASASNTGSTSATSTGGGSSTTTSGTSTSVATSTSTSTTCDPPPIVYLDSDGDGYGDDAMSMMSLSCDVPAGYALEAGDCKDMDPIAYTGAEGVCGDFVDDDCDNVDEKCPESLPMKQLNIPNWDCFSKQLPPENVYGWASFNQPGDRLKSGACLVFFEGAKDRFYVKAQGVEAANDCGDERFGCICPSLNGWPSYDRRLYAFSVRNGVEESSCEEVALKDHAGEEQSVSNSCRKYLYQLHARGKTKPLEFSHVASSLGALEQRLKFFSTVEIACAADNPHKNLPFASLSKASVMNNATFKKMK